jgi:hypothetical protein
MVYMRGLLTRLYDLVSECFSTALSYPYGSPQRAVYLLRATQIRSLRAYLSNTETAHDAIEQLINLMRVLLMEVDPTEAPQIREAAGKVLDLLIDAESSVSADTTA